MTLDDFQPYILTRAKGCPGAVANLYTRLAIIELCRESLMWRETQPDVTTVLDQTAYAYSIAAGQQVCELLSLTLDTVDVEVVDPLTGRQRDSIGYIGDYAYGKFSGFELRPAGAASRIISTYCAVAPALTATTVPDEFGRYVEQIAEGCLWRVLSTKDKEYSDAAGATRAKVLWDAAIAAAKDEAYRGNARVVKRTEKVFF